MPRFTLSRIGTSVIVTRHADGVPDHSWHYGVKLSGSSRCRRRQFRVIAARFFVKHGV